MAIASSLQPARLFERRTLNVERRTLNFEWLINRARSAPDPLTDQVSQSLPTGEVPLSYFKLNVEKWQSGRM